MTRLAFVSGSTRTDSFHLKLLRQLAEIAEAAGAEVEWLDLEACALPIYNGDLEAAEGLPAGAKQIKDVLIACDGMLIASPEYNGFMSPLLINAIDWATRSDANGVELSAFDGNAAMLVSCSPGPGGGARSVAHLRTMLSGIGTHVLPKTLSVASAYGAFDDQGKLKDEAQTARAVKLVEEFIAFCNKLS